jgi:hypothetical protein
VRQVCDDELRICLSNVPLQAQHWFQLVFNNWQACFRKLKPLTASIIDRYTQNAVLIEGKAQF